MLQKYTNSRIRHTCKHGMEVWTAGGQHHLVCLDLFVGHMEHDVAEQATLPHAVHRHKGVMVVALGVVRDAVAIPVQQLHTPLHHAGAHQGLLEPGPYSKTLMESRNTPYETHRVLWLLVYLCLYEDARLKVDNIFFNRYNKHLKSTLYKKKY